MHFLQKVVISVYKALGKELEILVACEEAEGDDAEKLPLMGRVFLIMVLMVRGRVTSTKKR